MKITDFRDPQGKFARRKRVKKNRIIVLILIILALIIVFKANGNKPDEPQVTNKSELDAIKAEVSFKAKIENQAEQVYLQREIDKKQEAKKQIENQIGELENQLEIKRTESLSL